jgi:hypothetical protein
MVLPGRVRWVFLLSVTVALFITPSFGFWYNIRQKPSGIETFYTNKEGVLMK